MFAVEFETKSGVGEVLSKFIHAVVTGKAVRPKRQDMRLGKDDIHLTVTIIAGLRREGFYILVMTVFATERFPRRRNWCAFNENPSVSCGNVFSLISVSEAVLPRCSG